MHPALSMALMSTGLVDPEKQSIKVLTFGKREFHMVGIYRRGETLKSHLFPDLAINPSELLES